MKNQKYYSFKNNPADLGEFFEKVERSKKQSTLVKILKPGTLIKEIKDFEEKNNFNFNPRNYVLAIGFEFLKVSGYLALGSYSVSKFLE